MKNEHIVIGPGNLCLCGNYQGEAIGCAKIIAAMDATFTNSNLTESARLMADVLQAYRKDVNQPQPSNTMKTLEQINDINVLLGRPEALRTINTHKVNGLNEALDVVALDTPGNRGASHHYQIRGIQGPLDHHPIQTVDIHFQEGGLNEVGANGVTQESILAVVVDRLEGFQKGPYANHDNEEALRHVKAAIEWLHRRTKERIARGVEGQQVK